MLIHDQGRPEKLRGPGQRVKVGLQRQGGFHFESQLHPSCKLKTKKKKGHDLLTMTIATPIFLSISLLHSSSEEYCDCSIRVFRSDCSIRVYRSFKQVFKGPFMGPLSGWGQNSPVAPPLWAALSMMNVLSQIANVVGHNITY